MPAPARGPLPLGLVAGAGVLAVLAATYAVLRRRTQNQSADGADDNPA